MSQDIQPIGERPFGESVNLYNGGLSFTQVDVDAPGNGPALQLTRSYRLPDLPANQYYSGIVNSALTDWTLNVPRIETLSARNLSLNNKWFFLDDTQRCTHFYAATDITVQQTPSSSPVDYEANDWWHGYQLITADGASQDLLKRSTQNTLSPVVGGMTFPIVTRQQWMIGCVAQTANGQPGEGFLAMAPDGTRYWFDWLAYKDAPTMTKGAGTALFRRTAVMLVSRIEDRFGNSLVYAYDTHANLVSITASDGRQLSLVYQSWTMGGSINGQRLVSATLQPASGVARTWTYAYAVANGTPVLSQVTRPDGSSWEFDFGTAASVASPELFDYFDGCQHVARRTGSNYVLTVRHPSGLSATFTATNMVRGRSYTPGTCSKANPNQWKTLTPAAYAVKALTKKVFSGAGVSATWTYAYSPANESAVEDCLNGCAATVWTDVTDPEGHATRRTFSNRFDASESQLVQVDDYAGAIGSTLLRREAHLYASAVAGPWPVIVGSTLQQYLNGAQIEQLSPLNKRTITQGSDTFTWQATAFDQYAQATKTKRFSNLAGQVAIEEQTTYLNDLPHWVLGLPTQIKNLTANEVVDKYVYDLGKVTLKERWHFGKKRMDYTFSSAGQLASFTDGNGHTTTLGNYKRGIPQTITFPATTDQPTPVTKKIVVDDFGGITSINDENNNKTCYSYDAMGRLTGITWSSEAAANTCNTSTWAKANQSFALVTTAEYGIPAGHWKQTTSTGNGRQVTYYDALWRPLVEERYDSANATNTRSVSVKRYDAAGRLAFQSYPMSSLSNYASTTLQGSKTTYDALGRATKVAQDSELGVLSTTTAYQSGLKTKVTDARGNATTTSYMAYDEPTTDWPVAIVHSGGVYTDIVRDPYGKPTAITRRNSGSTLAETRSYTYNANQELCRQVEPETGATLMGYDGAGNLAWSAAGLSAGTACNAGGTTSAILARKVVRDYDARNRLKTLTFPDGDGNQVWTYAPDSLPTTIVTTSLSDTRIVTNQYSYNRRRLLATETQQLTNWGTYTVTHQYTANGHLASLVYPVNYLGSVVDYAPNALGQPTKAGSFASAVTYFPNGAIKSFTYGNGLKHTLTQNVRGLPDTSCDFASSCNASAVLNDGYDYDANGNVAAISDGRTGNVGDRTMTYDALDRLTKAVAPGMFGTATYTYDVLDNLTWTKVTGGNQVRDHYYCYDATWRLATVRTGSCTGSTVMSLGYDVQGNLATRNGVAYTFDYGNRLRQVAGQEKQYLYDGHGRRVASNRLINGSSVRRSIYGLDGKLLFVQDTGEAKRKEYIYLGSSLIAERSLPNTGAATPESLRYQHTDALGSPVAVSNESKAVVERTAYEPYGWAADRASRNGPGYTGHHEDAATGLVYMQQRYYDPVVGRFLSRDPVTANPNTGANFNAYWYANDNPYRFIDPDGRATCADKDCKTSTIDSVVPRSNSQPPPANGVEGLPQAVAQKVNEGYSTTVTFQNDNPNGASPNQPVETKTANMVERAISKAGVDSVNINSTTGGPHGVNSNHGRGRAVDINRVNGKRVNVYNAGATQIQEAAREGGVVRENFGPTIMEKTLVLNGSALPITNQSLIDAHQNHLHLSGQP